jgi:predicted negative regulator of RcsB-dependent stress response
VEPLRTEEEQIHALRQWWAANGSSTLVGIGVAIAIVLGGQQWQQRSARQSEQSAVEMQQLIQAVQLAGDDQVQRATAEHLATQLKSDRSGSRHGDYAAFVLAKLLVDKQDLAAAEKELRALVARQPDTPPNALQQRVYGWIGRYKDPQVGALARLRLARVVFAQDRNDDALAILDGARSDYFATEKLELRGDILRAKGDLEAARRAYDEAAKTAADSPGMLLELKRQDIATLLPSVSTATRPAEAPAKTTAPSGTNSEDKP